LSQAATLMLTCQKSAGFMSAFVAGILTS